MFYFVFIVFSMQDQMYYYSDNTAVVPEALGSQSTIFSITGLILLIFSQDISFHRNIRPLRLKFWGSD